MNKLLATLLLSTISTGALAHGYERYEYHEHHGGSNWFAPLVIGGAVGYILAQPRTVVVQQPSVVYTQPQVIYQAPPVPIGYHYESVLDANCNCYRTVLIQN